MGTYMTIAERWKQNARLSGIDRLPPQVQGLAMLAFFGGFSAALEATTAIADLPEDEAVQQLQLMHTEVNAVAKVASASINAGQRPQ